MKVVHLTSVHVPDDVRIYHKECISLARAGYEVVLVARKKQGFFPQGITFVPLAQPRNRLERFSRTVPSVLWQAMHLNGDVYHFHDPELIPAAILLKAMGKKIIYDVHEDVPLQMLSKHWVPTWARIPIASSFKTLEDLSVKVFDGIVTATPALARKFPSEKTCVVQNFPIISELGSLNGRPYRERDPILFYVGRVSDVRGAREMVAAVGALPASMNARLVMAGECSPSDLFSHLQAIKGWHKVEPLGQQNRSQVAHWLELARVGLVVLHPIPNYIEAQPVKLYEYMLAGIPVIASRFPLWSKVVEESQCGLTVDPLDVRQITQAMAWLLEHPDEAQAMGEKGRAAALKNYSWESEASKLIAFYESI